MMRTRRLRSSSFSSEVKQTRKKEKVGKHVRPVDPSLMTERQQLAFLLKSTAPQDFKENHDPGSVQQRQKKEQKRISSVSLQNLAMKQKRLKKHERPALLDFAQSRHEDMFRHQNMELYSGSNSNFYDQETLQHGDNVPLHSILNKAAQSNGNAKLIAHIEIQDHEDGKSNVKTSPTSTNDGLHLQIFESNQSDDQCGLSSKDCSTSKGFWGMNCCAICCPHVSEGSLAPPDVLFLCAQCDEKYPTQRALGRI